MCHIELVGDVLLVIYGVKAHNVDYHVESLNQFGYGGDFVGFANHNGMARSQLVLSHSCSDEVHTCIGIRVAEIVPQCIAGDGDKLAAQARTK